MGRGRGVKAWVWAPPGPKSAENARFFPLRGFCLGDPPYKRSKLRLRPSLDQAWLGLERRSAHTCCEVARGGSQSLRDSRRAPILRSSKEIASVRVVVGAEVCCTFGMVSVLGIVFVFVLAS